MTSLRHGHSQILAIRAKCVEVNKSKYYQAPGLHFTFAIQFEFIGLPSPLIRIDFTSSDGSSFASEVNDNAADSA